MRLRSPHLAGLESGNAPTNFQCWFRSLDCWTVELPDSLIASRNLLPHSGRGGQAWQQAKSDAVPQFPMEQQSGEL